MSSLRSSSHASLVDCEEIPTPTISNRAPPKSLPALSLDSYTNSKSTQSRRNASSGSIARFSSPTAEPIEMARPLLENMPIGLSPPPTATGRVPLTTRGINGQRPSNQAPETFSLALSVDETTLGSSRSGDSFWLDLLWNLLPYSLVCDLIKTPVPWKVLKRIVLVLYQRSMAELEMNHTPLLLNATKPVSRRPTRTTPCFSNSPHLRQGAIQGIPNFGQTCFMNSVLQSLASLEPFLAYLNRIIQVHHDQSSLNPSLSTSDFYAEQLLEVLLALNGIQADKVVTSHNRLKIDPRQLLTRIGKTNGQFRRKGEQQDAQEFLQALLGVVINEAQLDSVAAASDFMTFTDVIIPEEPMTAVVAGVEANGYFETWSGPSTLQGHGALSLSGLLDSIDKDQKCGLLRSSSSSTTSMPTEEEMTSINRLTIPANEFGSNAYVPEEKKQEDFEIPRHLRVRDSERKIAKAATGPSNSQGRTTSIPRETSWEKSRNQSTAMKILQSTISSITPSPLSGWLGSTIQCCNCQHVRPIRNTPFFDIPLVPTSVPAYLGGTSKEGPAPNGYPLPPCSIEQCLAEFTSVERVQDVECRACTILSEIAELQEEEMLLNGAMVSTEKRVKAKGGDPLVETSSLKEELNKVQLRLVKLQTTDPDEDDTELFCPDNKNESFFSMGDISSKSSRLMRCDARKCLSFTRCPSILCCHIQRRYYDPYTDRMEKCVQHVEFDEILNLAPYCAYSPEATTRWVAGSPGSNHRDSTAGKRQRMLYRLGSIIEHRGNAHGGHYICYRRFGSSWFRISDSSVSLISWNQVRFCQAYMLFYEAM